MKNIEILEVTRDISAFDYKELLEITEDIFLSYETKLVDQNNPFSLKALTLATFVKHKIMEEKLEGKNV